MSNQSDEQRAGFRLMYATFPDQETAERIAQRLIGERLAACVNILPEVRSVYRWEGKVESSVEVAMLIKTTSQQAGNARDVILLDHPFDTPAILSLDIDAKASSSAFLEWIQSSTK
ncbi:MAG: divalent-cation tolerance protein CutA [Pseudomonadota bacterium]